MKKQTLYGIGAVSSLVLALLFTFQPWTAADGEHEHSQRQVAPGFTLTDMQGAPLSLDSLKGKAVLVNFWATWCGPCRKEIPDFVELQSKYRDRGFVVVGLSVDRGGEKVVQSWLTKNTVNYPIALAGDEVFRQWQKLLPASDRGVIPTSFLIDPEGVIRHTQIGLLDKSAWEAFLLPLLPEPK